MLEAPAVGEMERRFGDRFAGMSLTHVELLHWPVWRHTFRYTTFESVSLDPMEEGLLLLVQAGLRSIPEFAALLGCSENYTRTMSARLAAVKGSNACLQFVGESSLQPTPQTATVLEMRHRQIPVEKQAILLSDAIFGDWLSYGNVAFELTQSPNPDDGPHRWLDSVVPSITHDDEAAEYTLSLLSEQEIVAAELEASGDLQWVTLWLGCYQPTSGSRGRFLLFNPAVEDTPMLELTLAFEQDLGRKPFKLYFPDGPLHTAELFWQRLSERILSERMTEELETNRTYLAEVAIHEQNLRQRVSVSSSQTDRVETSKQANTAPAPRPVAQEDSLIIEELVAAQEAVSLAEAKIASLEKQLASVPRIEHLEASQHPAVLRTAIRQSKSLLILICPWIRIKVLRPLLPDIDAAIRRGVHILIGYGMPKSSFHPDKTDDEALDELRQRQSGQQLWLVHLGTHEKVIVQDDQIFVNSSFNFFSYTGGDGRRESGTLQHGGVGPFRDKFISAFPEHIQQSIRELCRPTLTM